MNKTPRLSKSGIEYLDYQWGIFSGCENWANGICPVPNCWARSIAYRFPNHYPDGFNPHYYPEAVDSPTHLKKPSIIGVGWVGDIIGYGFEFRDQIFETIKRCPQHKFLFLTKNPECLSQWSPFPANCFVGYTATSQDMLYEGSFYIRDIEAKVKYVSLEPCLDFNMFHSEDLEWVNWVIIGAQTKPTVYPKIEWVEEIVRACDKVGVRVFLKYNLMPLILKEDTLPIWAMKNWVRGKTFELRQELPDA